MRLAINFISSDSVVILFITVHNGYIFLRGENNITEYPYKLQHACLNEALFRNFFS